MAHSKKVSKELLDLLNRAIAREMQVSIQYILSGSMSSGAVSRLLRSRTNSGE